MMYEVIVPKNVQKVIDALSDEKLRDRIEEKLEDQSKTRAQMVL